VQQVEHLAGFFEDKSIVLFVDDAPVGLGAILGTPLQFLYGITSFDLQEDQVNVDLLGQQVARWFEQGYSVYVARNPSSSTVLFSECLVYVNTVRFDVPFLEASYHHAPSRIKRLQHTVDVFRFEPACQMGD
jgi:hypothetical protein